MSRQRREAQPHNSSAEGVGTPSSAEDRHGKRGHDEHGNVRPADGRYGLHEPQDESEYVRAQPGDESGTDG